MGLLQDLFNRIAQTNLGELIGMRWEPDTDTRHQRARFMEHVAGQLEHLNTAKKLLERGDFATAGEIAYRTFALFPFAMVTALVEAHELANDIIAGLPGGYVPPNPMPPIVLRRIAADKVAAHLLQAKALANEGKLSQALSLIDGDTGLVHIFSHGGVHKIDVQWELTTLSGAIRDKLTQPARSA